MEQVRGGLPLCDRWLPLPRGRMISLFFPAVPLAPSASPFPTLFFFFFFFLVSFSLGLAASASLWREGWCCRCKSKRAWGTWSHHTGGGGSGERRQNSDGAWKGRIRVLLKMRRRRKRRRQNNPGGSTHEAMGWAGDQSTNPSEAVLISYHLSPLTSLKVLGGDTTWQLEVSRICLSRHLNQSKTIEKTNNQPELVSFKCAICCFSTPLALLPTRRDETAHFQPFKKDGGPGVLYTFGWQLTLYYATAHVWWRPFREEEAKLFPKRRFL